MLQLLHLLHHQLTKNSVHQDVQTPAVYYDLGPRIHIRTPVPYMFGMFRHFPKTGKVKALVVKSSGHC